MRHHLAILYPTYLHMIRGGVKTIECRLTRVSIPPFGVIEAGDLLWLKESSGPVRLVAEAARVQTFDALNQREVARIRRQLNHGIRADPTFWKAKQSARYGTLIWLEDVQPIEPFRVVKTDRSAWVLLDGPPVPGQPITPALT